MIDDHARSAAEELDIEIYGYAEDVKSRLPFLDADSECPDRGDRARLSGASSTATATATMVPLGAIGTCTKELQ